jgi:TonB family protein
VKLPLPEDPARRAIAIAVACSLLLHVMLFAALFLLNGLGARSMAKRGEPLFVDITPGKPEEKAPLGNPAKPPGPPPAEPVAKAPELPAPPPRPAPPRPASPPVAAPRPEPPRVAARPEPPRPAPPKPAPEPPKQIAKAPPPPEPPAAVPAPEPPPPAPTPPPPAAAPREAPASEPASPPPQPAPPAKVQDPLSPGQSPSAGSGSQTALAKPSPPSIFRNPGGGGGLHGGRGGTAGEPIPLDTPDPNYREYMEKVKERIYAKWGYPYEAQTRGLQGKLVVEFHIAKDGHLQFIELRDSSGEEILDTFAMTAVKLAQVYPPLPDAMKRDVLPVVAVFVYTLRGPLSVLQNLQ